MQDELNQMVEDRGMGKRDRESVFDIKTGLRGLIDLLQRAFSTIRID
jgi:hypothetical protein